MVHPAVDTDGSTNHAGTKKAERRKFMRVTPQGEGGAKRGSPRQVPRSLPLKHTTG